jgi:hypothetical protein
MKIIDQSYYDHDKHGLIKVVGVTDGEVLMEKQDEVVQEGSQKMLAGAKQSVAGFRRDAEPADINVDAIAAEFNLTGRNQ